MKLARCGVVQVWLLYEASRQGVDPDEKEALLTQARGVLHTAAQVLLIFNVLAFLFNVLAC
jgi:hypothetical protein